MSPRVIRRGFGGVRFQLIKNRIVLIVKGEITMMAIRYQGGTRASWGSGSGLRFSSGVGCAAALSRESEAGCGL